MRAKLIHNLVTAKNRAIKEKQFSAVVSTVKVLMK